MLTVSNDLLMSSAIVMFALCSAVLAEWLLLKTCCRRYVGDCCDV